MTEPIIEPQELSEWTARAACGEAIEPEDVLRLLQEVARRNGTIIEEARARVLESGLEEYRAVVAALAFKQGDCGPEWVKASQRTRIAQQEHWLALKRYAELLGSSEE